MTVSKTIHFYNLLFYPCFMNNMKVYSRITTLLDYKNRQKQQNNKERIIFFPLKTFFNLSYCHFNKKKYLCTHKGAL